MVLQRVTFTMKQVNMQKYLKYGSLNLWKLQNKSLFTESAIRPIQSTICYILKLSLCVCFSLQKTNFLVN